MTNPEQSPSKVQDPFTPPAGGLASTGGLSAASEKPERPGYPKELVEVAERPERQKEFVEVAERPERQKEFVEVVETAER